MVNPNLKPLPKLTGSDIARFWRHVQVGEPNECWPWIGAQSPFGYGSFRVGSLKKDAETNRQIVGAHRISLMLKLGYDPFPLFSLHHCDYPPCCNGAHLFPGSKDDNMRDASAKGRTASGDRNGSQVHPEMRPRGLAHGMVKLTEDDVRKIRSMYPGRTLAEIAAIFSIGFQNVSLIVNRKRWKHLV